MNILENKKPCGEIPFGRKHLLLQKKCKKLKRFELFSTIKL
jgi:hypothetical protein